MPWNKDSGKSGTVRIEITRDYGQVVVKEGEVTPPQGASVMEALKSFAKVETDYGGGFVSSIEGTSNTSGAERSDWFYYLNGIMPAVGADDMQVSSGDSIWWDYHEWQGDDYAPAVVGAYPAPFTRTFGGVKKAAKLLYAEGMETIAREVGAFLAQKGAQVSVTAFTADGLSDADGPTMVFMTCQQATATKGVSSMLTPQRGAFVAIDGDGLVALDSDGNPVKSESTLLVAVVSTARGMGDEAPVWFVLCREMEDAAFAQNLLTSDGDDLNSRVGVVLDEAGQVGQVPK